MYSKEVCLKFISELGREIIKQYKITLKDLRIPRFQELIEIIWDLHPYLYHEENYEIYWAYNEITFLKVNDFFSYNAALTLMCESAFYIIIRDTEAWIYDDPAVDNCYCSCNIKYSLVKEYNRNKLLYMDFNEYLQHHNHIKDEDVLMEALIDDTKPICHTWDQLPDIRKLEHAKLDLTSGCKTYHIITETLFCLRHLLVEHNNKMTGDIMSFAHKDIYYLETKTKTQTSEDLVNLFASPAGRELVKYKPKAKTKYKAHPVAMDFFTLKPTSDAAQPATTKDAPPEIPGGSKVTTTTPTATSPSTPTSSVSSICHRQQTRRKSLELYNEAATILGLTCSQTNDCKCIECQCHYFDDLEEDLDYTSPEYGDHQSLCSIQ